VEDNCSSQKRALPSSAFAGVTGLPGGAGGGSKAAKGGGGGG
jgi:hypothetical protein